MSLRNSISIIIIIILDFIIYILPVCLLVLIPNLFISLIWYLPSIYQLYSFIFTTKEEKFRIRIYLFILSPIIIILYIPCCIITFIAYIIFITIINPIVTIARRPEYPFYLISSTAAIARLIYQQFCEHSDDKNLLIDSLIFKPINDSIEFSKECWNFHSSKFPEKKVNIGVIIMSLIILLLVFLFDLITIFIAYILVVLFYLTMVVSIFIIVKYFVTLFDISIEISKKSIENILKNHKRWISIIVLIFILPLSFIVSIGMFPIIFLFYIIFYVLINIIILTFKVMYKMGHTSYYYDIMSFFWAIIIKPFLTSDFNMSAEMELFIYNIFGINITYSKELVKEVNKYYIF